MVVGGAYMEELDGGEEEVGGVRKGNKRGKG